VLVAAAAARPEAALAQAGRVVRGTVTDSGGAPLPFAVVGSLASPRVVTTAGPSGGFVLRVDSAVRHVIAAHVGFAPETLALERGGEPQFRLRPAPITIEAIAVEAERVPGSAGSRVARELDAMLRPRASAQELLRLAPGVVIAQHAGGGKAEQIFLRGFDADHGTDVALDVDGTPVNQVSHAHGQGYADLHFVIPDLVAGLEVRKGPYEAADGDFATAGAVSLRTRDRLAQRAPSLEVRAGSFHTRQSTALVPLGGPAGTPGGYLAAALHQSDGPFEAAQTHRRANLFARASLPAGRGVEMVATASGHRAGWHASGQIPVRAVQRGLISRFGALDPSEGGRTSRYEASLALRSTGSAADWQVRAYLVRSTFTLYSNFTFYLNDTANGDGIGQREERWTAGARASYARPHALGGRPSRWDAGAGVRADVADLELFRQAGRQRLSTTQAGLVRQTHLYAWAREGTSVSERLRVEVALRGDALRPGYGDRVAEEPRQVPGASRWHAMLHPKANLAYRLARTAVVFATAASGFHSNDARSVAQGEQGVLPRAVGYEAGVRRTWAAGTLAVVAWRLDLESERVFSGDEGTTEDIGRTRRHGLEVEARLRVVPGLWFDADVNLARGRLRDAPPEADRVPLAPSFTATAGLTLRDRGPASGGVRLRHIGSRPADETNAVRARGSSVVEAFSTLRAGSLEIRMAVDNVLNAAWNEAQFATTSRLRGEREPVTELHFTPGAPRAFQVGVGYRF
jgi:outer membrane receptor protein involved in Fe transport